MAPVIGCWSVLCTNGFFNYMKETFYFPHDYNSTQDPKMMAILSTCGLAGIGMYWILIEILHQQEESKILYKSYEDFIDFYGRNDDKNEHVLNNIKQVLINVGLIIKDGDYIYSNRVLNNKKERARLSELRSKAGKISAKLRQNQTSVEHVSTRAEQLNKIKVNKIKDNKEELFSNNEIEFPLNKTNYSYLLSSPQRHIQVLGLFARWVKTQIDNKGQLKMFISRHSKPAKILADAGYTNEQLEQEFSFADKESQNGSKYRWTLETIIKSLTK